MIHVSLNIILCYHSFSLYVVLAPWTREELWVLWELFFGWRVLCAGGWNQPCGKINANLKSSGFPFHFLCQLEEIYYSKITLWPAALSSGLSNYPVCALMERYLPNGSRRDENIHSTPTILHSSFIYFLFPCTFLWQAISGDQAELPSHWTNIIYSCGQNIIPWNISTETFSGWPFFLDKHWKIHRYWGWMRRCGIEEGADFF